MDRVHLAYDFVRAYVYALLLSTVATCIWVVSPEVVARPQMASIWAAVAGFGTIVLFTFGLTHLTRSV